MINGRCAQIAVIARRGERVNQGEGCDADHRRNEKKFEMAVVTAHMACEVATERSLSKALRELNKPGLQEAVTDLLNGYNLAREKTRKLYTALTGDQVAQQPFWSDFKDSATRRNHIVHKGLTVVDMDAQKSVDAANRLVAHLPR
jgi:hypothetical protein